MLNIIPPWLEVKLFYLKKKKKLFYKPKPLFDLICAGGRGGGGGKRFRCSLHSWMLIGAIQTAGGHTVNKYLSTSNSRPATFFMSPGKRDICIIAARELSG